jgi:hypothetical protein
MSFTLITVLILLFSTSSPLPAGGEGNEGSHVLVVLKNKQVVKLQYDSFSFNWTSPRLTDFLSCRSYDFTKDRLVFVKVTGKKENLCDGSGREEWIFEVKLKNRGGDTLLGFFELTEQEVTGRRCDSGALTAIPLETIQRVSFYYR